MKTTGYVVIKVEIEHPKDMKHPIGNFNMDSDEVFDDVVTNMTYDLDFEDGDVKITETEVLGASLDRPVGY